MSTEENAEFYRLTKKYGKLTLGETFELLEAGEKAIKAMTELVAISQKEFSAIMALEDYEEIILEYREDNHE